MDEKIKPCPFCGDKTEKRISRKNAGHGETAETVGCYKCFAEIEESYTEKAIDKWNNAYCWDLMEEIKSKLSDRDRLLDEMAEVISKLCGPQFLHSDYHKNLLKRYREMKEATA